MLCCGFNYSHIVEMNFTQPLARTGLCSDCSSSKKRRASAFTIVEVMMAACVMALALTSGFAVMGRSFAPQDTARCISYASQIMQSEMEKIRITGWGNGTTAGTGTGTGTNYGVTNFSTTPTVLDITALGYANSTDLSRRMTLTRTASDVHTGVIRITLTITWTTFDGRSISRSYFTYYGKAGLYDYFAA